MAIFGTLGHSLAFLGISGRSWALRYAPGRYCSFLGVLARSSVLLSVPKELLGALERSWAFLVGWLAGWLAGWLDGWLGRFGMVKIPLCKLSNSCCENCCFLQFVWVPRLSSSAVLAARCRSHPILGAPGQSWAFLRCSWVVLCAPGRSWALLRVLGHSWYVFGGLGHSWVLLGIMRHSCTIEYQ